MKWTSHSHIFLHKWNIRDFFKRLCSLIRIVFSFYACQPSALLFKVLSPRSIFCLFTYFGVFLSEWWFFQYISGSEVWGCFVGPTWKCLFYSTSCFQRPFVNFSCSVCVCVWVCFGFPQWWAATEHAGGHSSTFGSLFPVLPRVSRPCFLSS